MILEVIPTGGLASGAVILVASQVVARLDDGTPFAVLAHYGADRAVAAAVAGDADFERMLRSLGVEETVICDRLVLPRPPAGARLVAGPGRDKGQRP